MLGINSLRCFVVGGLMVGAMPAVASDLETVRSLQGCYVVDYSYSETEVLDPQYQLDPRVYDVSGFVVKEWVDVVDETADSLRLQHFMQADDHQGRVVFMMRHTGENWRRSPSYRYVYQEHDQGADHWRYEALQPGSDQWSRDILSLDDGLRYQCLGGWAPYSVPYPQFTCSAFAPIPGRETRDMGRTDYNTMQRQSEVRIYQGSWLERQDNIKIHQTSLNQLNSLVREKGKIWSVKVPDSHCSDVAAWAAERQAFWDILASVWQGIYGNQQDMRELKLVDGTTRAAKIAQVREAYYQQVVSDPQAAADARLEIEAIIDSHWAP